MTFDRWEQVNKLYYAALDVEEKERPSFLEEACGRDTELRAEVESLLSIYAQLAGIPGQPSVEDVAKAMKSDPPSLPGRKLGPYQIQAVIGSGGMGEVYKAKDSRLNRIVAIKVLPHLLSERADLRQRFEREARAIASLNHPNICALYDIGREEGTDFLVMEYLEGEMLSQRLKKGPLPTDQLLRTGIEIAMALDQAHRHGVTHRDLKPGNIMLTKTGAKLLDFGLAKQSGSRPPDGERSPIGDGLPHSESLTEEGVILGTLEYMAPEQVEGKEIDARTDIFAFGLVMYEMATGRKAFEGESRAGLASAILTSEPVPISKIQPMTPPALDHVVKRCLTKDPDERWQSAGDITSELKWIAEAGGAISGTAAGTQAAGQTSIARGRRRELLYGTLVVAFLVVAIVNVVSYLRPARPPAHAVISEIPPPEKWRFNFSEAGPPALSPDEGTIAFPAADASGKTMLWVRSLDSLTAQPLAGTEGGNSPFWSPDGRSLGFFADGKLKTLAVLGGPAVEVAEAPSRRGGSWNREGTLLFVPDVTKDLYQVAASGGAPVPVFKLDPPKDSHYSWPRFLPDGKHFLYHSHTPDPASSGTYFASLDGKENRFLVKGNIRAAYASRYLFYFLDRTLMTLMAQEFDPERGQLKGDAHPVATGILDSNNHYCFFDVSENGVLIYQGGSAGGERRITWFDRSGKELSAGDREKGRLDTMRLSPDGAKLAFNAGDPTYDIWVDELARGVHLRLTNEPGADHNNPTWSPDGSRILFSCADKSRQGIYQMNSDGSGGKELLLAKETSGPAVWPADWSPDGRFILIGRGTAIVPLTEVWVLPLVGDRKPRFIVQNAYTGQFSPDGRWVAYTSWESGKAQIYVVPFDASKVLKTDPGSAVSPSGKWQISTSGGNIARWRRNGKEIFYYGPNNQMMAAEVDGTGINFEVRKEQVLFRIGATVINEFDVTPDGNRFVMATQNVNPNAPLTLVQNWTALLGNKP